jgi:subtilisin family serine protease
MRLPHSPWMVVAIASIGIALAPLALPDSGRADGPSPSAAVHMDPARRLAAHAAQSMESARERRLTAPRSGGQEYYVLHVEFQSAAACNAFNVAGITALTRFDKFATLFVAREDEKLLDAVDHAPGVVWVELDDPVQAPPPPRIESVKESAKGSDPIVRGGLGGLTGKGVLIAVVDTGIDYHNPDFIDVSSGKPTSRLLAYWDTLDDSFDRSGEKIGSRPPCAYPNKASIGTLFTRAQITDELRAATARNPEPDADGHGTACAAVAAGNGRSSDGKYRGVAPGADLIGVRIASGAAMENGFLLGAVCEWLEQMARREGRPLVISCSFGSQDGGHDGCRIEERELDARFPLTAKGRAVCLAAGNEDQDGLHARVEWKGVSARRELEWTAHQGLKRRGPKSAEMAIYVDGATPDEVDASGQGVKVVTKYVHPLSRSTVLQIDLPADGKLDLTYKGDRTVTADAYVYGVGGRVRFADNLAALGQLVCSPGLARNTITVGSYDFNAGFDFPSGPGKLNVFPNGKPTEMVVGAISAYSSRGYSRRGDTKPDIAAPGEYHFVPAVKGTDRLGLPRDATGKLTVFDGTSAATPYVAGVVALMLEKNRDLTLGQIKDLLHNHATHDKWVGAAPNATWGYGKLDVEAVKGVLSAVERK